MAWQAVSFGPQAAGAVLADLLPVNPPEPEGCLPAPNQPAKYGPDLAGRILVRADDSPQAGNNHTRAFLLKPS